MNLIVHEREVIASLVKKSFFEFVKEFWDVIITDEPVWNWHIPFLCKELEKLARAVKDKKEKENDLLINIPPGSTKSTICSEMFVAWVWTWFPQARFICGSHTDTLRMDLALKTRDIVLSEKYRRCFGLRLREDQSTKGYFVNNKGGARLSTTVGSKVTGFHGHFIIVDDPIDPEGARSEAEMKVANRWMKETIPSRVVNKTVTPIILIMQRLHQDDPSANMLKRGSSEDGGVGVKHICLPAELTENVKPESVRAKYKDGLFDSVRLPQKILAQIRRANEYAYAGQYLQNPVPESGGFFKTDRIIVEEEAPKKFVIVVRYWDKAGTKDGGAYSSGVKIGKDIKGRFWILHCKRFQYAALEREEVIKQTAMLDGRTVRIGIEQEPGSGGKESAENTVRNLAGWSVTIDRATGSKEARAEPLKSQMAAGNVYMLQGEWNEEFIEELQYFPFSKYKDQADAASGAFNQANKPKIRVGAF